MPCTQESGTCPDCVNPCYRKPGWFLPGEAERVAEFLGLTLPELFRQYLGVDWWEEGTDMDRDVFVLAPATTTMTPGEEYPGQPRGICVFLDEHRRCRIHPVKPHECRQTWCGNVDTPEAQTMHLRVAQAWAADEHHAQIRELLGRREPQATEYEPMGWLWQF